DDPFNPKRVFTQQYLRAVNPIDKVHDGILAVSHVPDRGIAGLANAGDTRIGMDLDDHTVSRRNGADGHNHRFGELHGNRDAFNLSDLHYYSPLRSTVLKLRAVP